MLAMAATVILAVTVVLWSLIERPNSIEPEVVYETSIGEHSTVNLVDGTNLTLNTNSRVKVKYAERHRMLILERGEIFVEVAHDPDRPLSVYVGSNVVQAVGTAFSVRINNSQEIELVVSNGKVLVGVDSRVKEGQSPESPISLNPTSQAILGEQRVILGSSESVVENLNPEDLQVSMSWRDGTIVFRGESLEEALLEVNRYTPIEFVFLDEELKNVRIAGLFKAGDVDGLLSTLRANFNITNERVGEEKVLLKAE